MGAEVIRSTVSASGVWQSGLGTHVCLCVSVFTLSVVGYYSNQIQFHAVLCARSIQACQPLWGPRTAAQQAPLSGGFSRQDHGSGFPSPRGIVPTQGRSSRLFTAPALAGGVFTSSTMWEARRPLGCTVKPLACLFHIQSCSSVTHTIP